MLAGPIQTLGWHELWKFRSREKMQPNLRNNTFDHSLQSTLFVGCFWNWWFWLDLSHPISKLYHTSAGVPIPINQSNCKLSMQAGTSSWRDGLVGRLQVALAWVACIKVNIFCQSCAFFCKWYTIQKDLYTNRRSRWECESLLLQNCCRLLVDQA